MNQVERAAELARLCLALGRVERATSHEDGRTPESDTDHTVMLAVIADDLCPDGLDRGLVSRLAVAHDILEAYTGDVQTLIIDADGRSAKDAAERAAFKRLEAAFGSDSRICEMVRMYERQEIPEAHFVKILDKVLPKLTHLLNGCVAADRLTDYVGFVDSHNRQLQSLRERYGADWRLVPVLDLLEMSMWASEDARPKDIA